MTRNAEKFGGVVLFTGGLIGNEVLSENYAGDFENTPVFIATGNPDAHVPVQRVLDTQKIMEQMNAKVSVEIYDNRPHTIIQDEIDKSNSLVFNK